MQAIVTTLVNSFGRFFDFLRFLWSILSGWIGYIWTSGVHLLGLGFEALTTIFYYITTAVTDVFLFIISAALAILPAMPQAPNNPGSFDLGMANRYIPFTEVAALTGFWVVIFGGIGAYKFAKIVRGGG